ncbi:Xaa-Pro dipeptidyl-peptidase [Lacticaseibacillus zhaodongensis]|uniref:Xaa-Pro dipeptidyl-peptidase n=1 Tax=Lacticaseibacillus zhaodongensis TaxID=2668065 RepID=UPI0012D33B8E|nr:Xaa-Pro dipeptidyl-peptidase [Lacticaseibacillus zhaodongensis]
MKLNQFARLTPDLQTQKSELTTIGLPTTAPSFAELAAAIFAKFEPEAQDAATTQEALADRAVDEQTDLAAFLAQKPTSFTGEQFYTVALQYLSFEVGIDFKYGHALEFMDQTLLPHLQTAIATQDDLVRAVYLLLNTRSKNLVTLIDALAARGFFQQQLGNFKIFNGKALPTFDTSKIIRERVWIESDLDTDGDGERDMLEATIFRPVESGPQLRVPALFTANPYFHGTNDVTAVTHDPEPELAVKPARTQAPAQAPQVADLPHRRVDAEADQTAAAANEDGIYSLNDYFLARGFATVYSAGVGTMGSDGLRSTGGPDETASAVAVIEWLAGTRRAFTSRTGYTAIKANWCNGSVAMTGKSYLGTLAIAAATSGTPALKTAISESAISSWYDYYRENGLVVAPGGFQGEDADVLAVDTYSRIKAAGDANKVNAAWQQRLADLERLQDRKYGDYTPFWDARNYRKHVANIKCDIVSVHGLNDWNVKPRNVIEFHKAVAGLPIRHKMFLHQGQHVYLNNVRSLDFTDQMNLWLSAKLLGVNNDALNVLPDLLIQDNVQPETWVQEADFGRGGNVDAVDHVLGDGQVSFTDNSFSTFTAAGDTSASYETAIIQPESAYADSRLVLKLPVSANDTVIEGTAHLHLRVKVDGATAIVSTRLIDLGSAKRFTPNAAVVGAKAYPQGFNFSQDNILEFGLAKKPSAAKLISLAHCNLQNPHSAAESVTVEPNRFVDLDFDLQPTRYRLPAERQFALIIHGADMAQTIRPRRATKYTVDLSKSVLTLPVRKQND